MKLKINKNIIKKVVNKTTVFYDTESGAFYGVDGALQQFFAENDAFELDDIIAYLTKEYGLEYSTASKDAQELLTELVDAAIVIQVN